jgi:carboxypeptidase C (cathepsin A)
MADTTPEEAPEPKAAEATEIPAEPTDDIVTTRHTLTVKRKKLAYTAKAGRVVLRKEVVKDGKSEGFKAKAEVFVTSYTLDDADPGTRPVTFAFNGGPGSSSVWLHLGLLGPRRVVMGDAGALLPPPYGLVDNAESLLTASDLVFIDPISTGYSRAATGGKSKEFHGYQADVESVGEVIRLWTSRNGRWMSPKYLCGESYGTLRAASLAGHLQERYGMYLNGLMLISSVLDAGTVEVGGHNDAPYAMFLPTYAAVAHYHGLLEGSLRQVLDEAEAFAGGDYLVALARGARLADRSAVVRRLQRLTGLDADFIDRADLRIEDARFFAELLRSRRRVVGRLDGRFLGWDADAERERPGADPSYQAIQGPYTAALNHYVRAELEYANDLPYEILTDRVYPWSYKEFEGQHVHVADRLAAAMRANQHLRVYVACGYYDGATPYFAVQHTVAHLAVPAELQRNVTFEYFEAGHMMYVHEPSRIAQSAQLRAFVAS